MKFIISILVLLALNACAEEEKKYLTEFEGKTHLNNGGILFCKETSTENIVIVNKSWEVYRLNGVSFYVKGSQAILTSGCTLKK